LFFIFLSCDVFNKAHFCEDGYVFVWKHNLRKWFL
jgi:hypothetical protein